MQVRTQDLRAPVHFGGEGGLALVQLAAHVYVVIAEAREKEDHRTFAPCEGAGCSSSLPQGRDGGREVPANDGPPVEESLAARVQGERHVREVGRLAGLQPVRQAL